MITLDEPTSGLDSFSATVVSKILASKADAAVLCTMHQPSTKLFVECLREVAVLSKTGSLVYFGPASKAVAIVSAKTGEQPLHLASPGEFLLDVATDLDVASPDVSTFDQVGGDVVVASRKTKNENLLVLCPPSLETRPAPSAWTQFRVLLVRSVLNTRRSPAATYAALGRSVTTALLVGASYYAGGRGGSSSSCGPTENDESPLSQSEVTDRTGALFFVLVHQSFAAVGSVRTFLEERGAYDAERRRGLGDPLPYFVAKSLAEVPLHCIFATIFACIAYPLVGFRPSLWAFSAHVGVLVLATLVAESLVVAVSAASPDARTAVVLAPVVLSVGLLSAGFLVDLKGKPLALLRSTSYFARAFSAAAKIEFAGRTVTCGHLDKEALADRLRATGLPARLFPPKVIADLPCPVPDGDAHLARLLGADDSHRPIANFDLPILLGLLAIFRGLAYAALARRGKRGSVDRRLHKHNARAGLQDDHRLHALAATSNLVVVGTTITR
mmetsp:Transcript_6930/g.22535  ORF Transcript_6930/g.22535 Transcript_6930/m.22535 type:complete len:500 (+) Transcript_6930:2498-3997(+)